MTIELVSIAQCPELLAAMRGLPISLLHYR